MINKTVYWDLLYFKIMVIDSQKQMRLLIIKAVNKKIIAWNDGLVFSEFIYAFWRTLKNHKDFAEDVKKITDSLPSDEHAIELLAKEFNEFRSLQL